LEEKYHSNDPFNVKIMNMKQMRMKFLLGLLTLRTKRNVNLKKCSLDKFCSSCSQLCLYHEVVTYSTIMASSYLLCYGIMY